MAQSQLKNSSSNNVAKQLKDRRYHQRVVKSKKAYDRKTFRKILPKLNVRRIYDARRDTHINVASLIHNKI